MCTQIELILGMCALQVAAYQSYKQYRVFRRMHPKKRKVLSTRWMRGREQSRSQIRSQSWSQNQSQSRCKPIAINNSQ
jgi:hypothetical protein